MCDPTYGRDAKPEECCEFPEHSGKMFDWWRCSNEGQIVHIPKPSPPPQPTRSLGLRRDQLCWPMYQAKRYPGVVEKKGDPDDCVVSKDYWPTQTDVCDNLHINPRTQGARPPWVPAKNPNSCGCPSTGNSTGRQKPIVPFVSRP